MSRRRKALRYFRSSKPENPLHVVLRGLLKLVVLLFLLYHLFFHFLLRSYRVETAAMLPAIETGSTVVASPLLFGPPLPIASRKLPALRTPKRGDVVIVRDTSGRLPWHTQLLDSAVGFFTLQRVSPIRGEASFSMPRDQMKRVVGVPGDTVRMEGFRVKIKTGGRTVFLDEREIIQREYTLLVPEDAEEKVGGFPGSGHMEELRLESGEYLLMSDNRTLAAVSRNWRASPADRVEALVLFTYTF